MNTHPTRRRTRYAAAFLAAAALTFTAVGSGVAPHSDDTAVADLSRNASPVHDGPQRTGSVEEKASKLVAEAAPKAGDRTSLRVVAVKDVAGAAEVEVENVVGTDAAEAAITEAQDDPDTLAVTVDRKIDLIEPASDTPTATNSATNKAAASGYTFHSNQWALTKLNAVKTWGVADGSGAVVAVLDTGVRGNHPDLQGQVLQGRSFVGSTGPNGSGNGWGDGHGHGTHVAGIVAADASNNFGVAGLAPAAKILPVKVMDNDGTGWSSDIAEGIIWAVEQGADVINLSLGGDYDAATEAAVSYALGSNVIVVAAAGNEYLEGNPITYPAALAGVIGVAATTPDNTADWYSNRGSYIDVAAPGASIYSTLPGDTYGNKSGTSMATPMVAAIAALAVDATGGDITPAAFLNQVANNARDLGTPGRDTTYGHGLIRSYATVCALSPACGKSTQPPPVVDDPAPGTPPTADPSPTRKQVSVEFTGGDTFVYLGKKRNLKVQVTDRHGNPVAGHTVRFVRFVGQARKGTAAATTNRNGYARLRVKPARTSRYRITAPASKSTTRAVSSWDVKVKVLPKVAKIVAGPKLVNVRVRNPRAQRVMLQRHVAGTWKQVSVRRLPRNNKSGLVRLPNQGPGTYRVKVAKKKGVKAVVSSTWAQ